MLQPFLFNTYLARFGQRSSMIYDVKGRKFKSFFSTWKQVQEMQLRTAINDRLEDLDFAELMNYECDARLDLQQLMHVLSVAHTLH